MLSLLGICFRKMADLPLVAYAFEVGSNPFASTFLAVDKSDLKAI
jgi:hypothetical protein